VHFVSTERTALEKSAAKPAQFAAWIELYLGEERKKDVNHRCAAAKTPGRHRSEMGSNVRQAGGRCEFRERRREFYAVTCLRSRVLPQLDRVCIRERAGLRHWKRSIFDGNRVRLRVSGLAMRIDAK
jgi:hypothetical protein